MKTTHGTLIRAYRHDGDDSIACQTRRSCLGFTVISFLATCLLPVGLHAQAPVFAGAQSVLYSQGTPSRVAVDRVGNVFIIDSINDLVAKRPAGGGATTVVFKGDDVLAGIAVDSAGNLYIADWTRNQVISVAANGGFEGTVGTGLQGPAGVAVDSSGNVFISDYWNSRIVKVPANGGPQTNVGPGWGGPRDLALDGQGNLFVLNAPLFAAGGSVYKFSLATSTVTQVADNLSAPAGIAADAAGDFFVDDLNAGVVKFPAGNGQQLTLVNANALNAPSGLAVDSEGDLYIADTGNSRALEIQTLAVNFGSAYVCPASQSGSSACSQAISLTFTQNSTGGVYESAPTTQGTVNLDFKPTAGGGCVASATGYTCAVNITFAPTATGLREGSVQVLDTAGDVTTIYLHGVGLAPQIAFTPSAQTTVGSGLKRPAGIAMDSAGNVYIADAANNRVVKVPAAGGAQTTVGRGLNSPEAVAVDGAGNVIIVDSGSGQVFKVSTTGVQTTVKANLTSLANPDGVAVDGEGNLYISDSFEGVVKVPANGGALTSIVSGLSLGTEGVAVDDSGDVYVADTGDNKVLRIPAGGFPAYALSTNGLKAPNGIARDAAGDLFICDSGNDRVVELPAAGGAQFTIASGLNSPSGVFVDAAGDVFIGDSGNNRVLKLERSKPPTLSFNSTKPGTTASGSPVTVIINNIGNQQLVISDVNYPTDFPVDFDENGSEELCIGSTVVMPGAVCDLAINFTPLSLRTFTENVTVTDDSMFVAPARQSVTVIGSSLTAQTITFTPPSSVTYGAAPVNLAGDVSDSSGLPITLSIVSGPAKISGTIVTFTGAGPVVVKAGQAGNSTYGSVSIQKTITVTKAVLTVAATSASVAYGKALPVLQFTVAGLVNGDKLTVTSGAPVETTTAKLDSPPAAYPINISQGTLRAVNYTFVFKSGILTIQSLSIASAPVSNPAGGTYKVGQHITLTDKTPGAAIYYALGGATPSISSTRYTGPISIARTETLKAIAVAPGYSNSPVASTTFTIQ